MNARANKDLEALEKDLDKKFEREVKKLQNLLSNTQGKDNGTDEAQIQMKNFQIK